jgi:hypothetical protein
MKKIEFRSPKEPHRYPIEQRRHIGHDTLGMSRESDSPMTASLTRRSVILHPS